MHFSTVHVIYNSTVCGYLTADAITPAAESPTLQRLADIGSTSHFSSVTLAARFPFQDAAEAVLSGLSLRFVGHHLHAVALDSANPVIQLVVRRPGLPAWRDMPTRDIRRARHERDKANKECAQGHLIVAIRADGATEWVA